MFKLFKADCGADRYHGLREQIHILQALVFPHKCLKCRQYKDVDREEQYCLSSCFCSFCLGDIPVFIPPYCLSCGRQFGSGENHLCESCLKSRPDLSCVRAAFYYQGIIKDVLGLFKYHAKLSLARILEEYLFRAFELYFTKEKVDLILPIPLHPRKLRQRGFNQSYLLVRNFNKKHIKIHGDAPPWHVDTRILERIKPTLSQTGFDMELRRKNLDQAFRVRHGSRVAGKSIVMVDDVYTTGATCKEAAKILLASGAARVDALVLARA